MKVQYLHKDTFFEEFNGLTNRTIRSILWTSEVILGKDSEEYKQMRTLILNHINNLNRDIQEICERDIFDKVNN